VIYLATAPDARSRSTIALKGTTLAFAKQAFKSRPDYASFSSRRSPKALIATVVATLTSKIAGGDFRSSRQD
jgi:hypothetical protein